MFKLKKWFCVLHYTSMLAGAVLQLPSSSGGSSGGGGGGSS
jgi:hypothetical protein